MANLNEKRAALFTSRNWGVIATIREDGSPQATPVWIDYDGENVLVNFVRYEPGTVVPRHAHDEEQVTFVLEGEFEFECDGETRTLRRGSVVHIPPGVPHAARTLDTSCLQVDVFSPPRRVLVDALEGRTPPA